MLSANIKLNYIKRKYKKENNPILYLKNRFPHKFNLAFSSISNNIFTNPNFSETEITTFFLSRKGTSNLDILIYMTTRREDDKPTTILKDNLPQCENFTFEWILKEPSYKWNWNSVWSHKNIDINTVLQWGSKFYFSSFGFACNRNLKICHFYLLNMNCILTRKAMSQNSSIRFLDILKNTEIPWDWSSVSLNPNIDLDSLIMLENKLDFEYLSMNRGTTLEMVKTFPNKKWIPHLLVQYANMTSEELKWYIQSQNNNDLWFYSSKNPNISYDFIAKNPSLNWDWEMIFENKFLHDDFVYRKTIKKDIEKRRDAISKLFPCKNGFSVVCFYVGYR
jgi:hypothetical protein